VHPSGRVAYVANNRSGAAGDPVASGLAPHALALTCAVQ